MFTERAGKQDASYTALDLGEARGHFPQYDG
jgi:hypothetical protein